MRTVKTLKKVSETITIEDEVTFRIGTADQWVTFDRSTIGQSLLSPREAEHLAALLIKAAKRVVR